MGPTHLAYFRQKLRDWREQLGRAQTIDNLRDEVRDIGDEAERATRETENSLELRTRDRYRKLIAKIDKALKRIEERALRLLRGKPTRRSASSASRLVRSLPCAWTRRSAGDIVNARWATELPPPLTANDAPPCARASPSGVRLPTRGPGRQWVPATGTRAGERHRHAATGSNAKPSSRPAARRRRSRSAAAMPLPGGLTATSTSSARRSASRRQA